MIHYSKTDILNLEKIFRLNLINSVSGYKSANLIATKSEKGQTNVAIFSSVIHLGSNPALLGFIMRPHVVQRHTLDNILQTKKYTINHIHTDIIDQAHQSSAKYPEDVSEFDQCQLSEEYHFDFHAPFVKESKLKIAMVCEEMIDIKSNGTIMVIGSIQDLILPKESLMDNGILDLTINDTVAISGLSRYHSANFLKQKEYARV